MFSDAELLRYARHIMLPSFDLAGQEALKASRVLIVGLGGIGCPVALYLAAAGVGELHLVDFDTVEPSNLQRQILFADVDLGRNKVEAAAEKLRALNPHIAVHTHACLFNDDTANELLNGMQVVVDGSDNFTTRDATNMACVRAGIPLVSAAAIGMEAQLAVFDTRDAEAPCYRCVFPAGDDAETSCAESGVLAPVVGVVGAMAATEVLKIVSGVGQTLRRRLWLWQADAATMRTLQTHRDRQCVVCAPYRHP